MAEQKKDPVVKTLLKEGTKEAVAAAGGLTGLLIFIKKYLFPDNSADANSSDAGLQANKDGKGPADERLFHHALAKEVEFLIKNEADEKAKSRKRKKLLGNFHAVFNAKSDSQRKQVILYVGLGEDKIGTKGKTENIKGREILRTWLMLDAKTLNQVLDAAAQQSNITKERIEKIDAMCADILEKSKPTLAEMRRRKKREECVSQGPFDLLKKTFFPGRK